jgi:hypothetical protein
MVPIRIGWVDVVLFIYIFEFLFFYIFYRTNYIFGSSGFCVETRSILIVSSFKIVLKVLPSKHLTLHKQKLSHKVEKSPFFTTFTINIVSQLFIIYIYFRIQKQKRELLQKASIISAKLEKVIRAASQAQEHTTMAGGFFSDLEVDLRLSDAEYALQHYNNLVKKRKFF